MAGRQLRRVSAKEEAITARARRPWPAHRRFPGPAGEPHPASFWPAPIPRLIPPPTTAIALEPPHGAPGARQKPGRSAFGAARAPAADHLASCPRQADWSLELLTPAPHEPRCASCEGRAANQGALSSSSRRLALLASSASGSRLKTGPHAFEKQAADQAGRPSSSTGLLTATMPARRDPVGIEARLEGLECRSADRHTAGVGVRHTTAAALASLEGNGTPVARTHARCQGSVESSKLLGA